MYKKAKLFFDLMEICTDLWKERISTMAPTKSCKKVSWSGGTHLPKPKRQKYSEETLQSALQAVANGMSQRKVADEFGILQSTLSDKLQRKILGEAIADQISIVRKSTWKEWHLWEMCGISEDIKLTMIAVCWGYTAWKLEKNMSVSKESMSTLIEKFHVVLKTQTRLGQCFNKAIENRIEEFRSKTFFNARFTHGKMCYPL